MANSLIDNIDRVIEIVRKSDHFLIISHNYPDGDSLGTQVALFELFQVLGKDARMICNGELPYQYMFLPHASKIEKDVKTFKSNQNKYTTFCVDSATVTRLNLEFDSLDDASEHIINIDHHKDNSLFGDINIIEPQKSAAAEIVYEMIREGFKDRLNYSIAVGIYTAILTDTGKFQYSSTTSSVHKIAANLIELGVNPAEVYRNVYENDPINRFKLVGRTLSRVNFDSNTKTIYSFILKKDFEELDLPFSAHNGIIEMLRSAQGAEIVALFKETSKNSFKISLRSSGRIDVSALASKFGGGGHKMAAAYEFEGSLKESLKSFLKRSEAF